MTEQFDENTTADRFDIEKLKKKAGGTFPLTVLIQKRLKELQNGAPKLVSLESKKFREIVCQEIIEGKIELVSQEQKLTPSEEVQSLFR